MIEVAPAYETAVETEHYLWCIPLEGCSLTNYHCLPQNNSRQNVEIHRIFPSCASVEKDEYDNLILHIPNNKPPFAGSESKVNCRLEVAEVQEPPVKPPVPEDLNEIERLFLQNSSLIDCEDKEIRSLSETITKEFENCFEAVVRIVSWVFSNIRFQYTDLEYFPSAKWVLQHRIGTCGDLSRLAVAMIRSYGLPARIVVGTLASPIGMTSHGWGEFYLPNIGWIPFEPTLGYVGWIDANHVKVAAILDETYLRSWFKAAALCANRQVEPPRLVKLKDVYLQNNSGGQRQLRLTLQNTTDQHLSTRVILAKDKAVFRDGKIDAPYDNLLYFPPKFTKNICLSLGSTSTDKTTLIVNLFLGAYYELELQENYVNLKEIPKEEYACSRCYRSKNKPPWVEEGVFGKS